MATVNPAARGLSARPNPAESFAEACERAASFDAAALQPLNPLGRTRLLVGEGPADEVVVLFHGLTNCPYQMRDIGALLHARGAAVFVPRLPRHGYADRRNNGLELLTAEELRACCDAALDIAVGLGKRITVAGISAGGVMAAWVAQFRPEVARAAIIAPSFSFGGRLGVTLGAIQQPLLLTLPNFDITRFDRRRAVILDHAYYNFPSHALGQALRLGASVWRAAGSKPPHARPLHVIINAADTAVNDDTTLALVQRWRRVGSAPDVYEFPASRRLIHDIIDPSQPAQQTALTYPVLLDALLH